MPKCFHSLIYKLYLFRKMSTHEEEEGVSSNHGEEEDVASEDISDEDLASNDDESLDSDLDDAEEHSGEGPEEDKDEIEQHVEVPKPIDFDSAIADISCHPKRNIVAVGTIDGPVYLHTYATSDTGNKEVISFEHHKKNLRVARFSNSGDHLFTGANDGTICVVDLQTNSIYRKFAREGGSPIYSLLPIDDYLMASGEDDGQVVLWDFRMQAPIQCFEDCEDYISSLTINTEKKILIATSGDGVMSAYNVRGKKLVMQSEEFDCDLLCSGIFKRGSKLVVGAGDGSLNIFNWGEFGNISDRFPGHPQGVNCLSVLSDDIICTGCEDGKIRAVQLFPNRFLGVLGSHHGFAVEKLAPTFDSSLIVSCSHDQKIQFWDLSGIEYLKNEDVKDTKNKHGQLNKEVNDFFADL